MPLTEQRQKTITWQDPAVGTAAMPGLSGLDYLRKMQRGELPGAPIASHFAMGLAEVGEGTVTFTCTPDESHYNPIGMVHGGLVCTLLDSAVGCSAHTLLPAGVGYTSVELKVNYLRAVTRDSGPLRAVGRVTKPGRRLTFAEATVLDRHGKEVANANGTLLVFPLA